MLIIQTILKQTQNSKDTGWKSLNGGSKVSPCWVPSARGLLFARNLYIYWRKSMLIIIWRFQLNWCRSPVCLSKAIHSLVQACVRATHLGAKIQTTCHPHSQSCIITLLEMETTHTALYNNHKFCIYIYDINHFLWSSSLFTRLHNAAI